MSQFSKGDFVDFDTMHGRIENARIVEVSSMLDAPSIASRLVRGTPKDSVREVLNDAPAYKVEVTFATAMWGDNGQNKHSLGGSYTAMFWVPGTYLDPAADEEKAEQLWSSPLA